MRTIAAPFAGLPLPVRLRYHLDNHMRREQQLALAQSWQTVLAARHSSVPTILFRSDAHGAEFSENLGWRTLCSDLTIVPVSGDHHSMFDPPNVAMLCDRFLSTAATQKRRFAEHGP
jgi:thioesterase domain-containing protein